MKDLERESWDNFFDLRTSADIAISTKTVEQEQNIECLSLEECQWEDPAFLLQDLRKMNFL